MSALLSDPAERLKRAHRSLNGLSVGDALGCYASPANARAIIVPPGIWEYTDDTNMALSIVSILRQYGKIDQDALALDFASYFDVGRGYGPGMRRLLPAIQAGLDWREGARQLFKGEGSLGNGGAMRIGPLGGYFADDLAAVVEQARLATEVTHAHPEGIAGGIAIAVGAAVAARLAGSSPAPTRVEFIALVVPHVPESITRALISKARDLPAHQPLEAVVDAIGNGSQITAMDTVPFCLWVVGETFGNYVEAFWRTARASGDRDTTCAIVGGMAALSMAEDSPLGLPAEWIQRREPLPAWAFLSGDEQ